MEVHPRGDHHPGEEQRIFLFMDLASSTSLAERLGHVLFHGYLDDCFHLMSDPIATCRGEIDKYVGDEIIVTWEKSVPYLYP